MKRVLAIAAILVGLWIFMLAVGSAQGVGLEYRNGTKAEKELNVAVYKSITKQKKFPSNYSSAIHLAVKHLVAERSMPQRTQCHTMPHKNRKGKWVRNITTWYCDAIRPFGDDVVESWIVKVEEDGTYSMKLDIVQKMDHTLACICGKD